MALVTFLRQIVRLKVLEFQLGIDRKNGTKNDCSNPKLTPIIIIEWKTKVKCSIFHCIFMWVELFIIASFFQSMYFIK